MIKFGLTYFAGFTICKINAKLSNSQREELENKFYGMQIRPIGKGLTRIEAIMPESTYITEFQFELQRAILNSQIEFKLEALTDLRNRQDGKYALADTLDAL
jgi:hypothetical protein